MDDVLAEFCYWHHEWWYGSRNALVGCATGEAKEPSLRSIFDRRIKLEFHGTRITVSSNDALGFTDIAITRLLDGRRGKNTRHGLEGVFRRSVFGGLASYEDVNDAERLARDPTMGAIFGREGLERLAALLRPRSGHGNLGSRAAWQAFRSRYLGNPG